MTTIEAANAEMAVLRAALEAEKERSAALEQERDRLRKAYDDLKIELEQLRRKITAAKAERIDTTALELEFANKLAHVDMLTGELNVGDAASDDDGAPSGNGSGSNTGKRKKNARKPTGRRDLSQTELPVERIEVKDPILEDLVAKGKAETAGFEESSKIGYRRGGHTRVVIARQKYVVFSSETTTQAYDSPNTTRRVVTTEKPPEFLRRSIAAPSLLAKVISDKFTYGMPFFRQEEKCAAEGISIDRGSMSRWVEDIGNTLASGLVAAARRDAMQTAICLATDATGIAVQPIRTHEKTRQPCRRAHFFVQIADRDHVFFEYTPRETSKAVYEMFSGFSGYVQADAKSVYDLLFREPRADDDVVDDGATRHELGCWAHMRRYFYEAAIATKDVNAREALYRIHRIFENEKKFRTLSPEQRKHSRDRLSRPHIDDFFKWVHLEYAKVEDQRGLLRTALGYARRQEDALKRFLDDGRLVLENNRSERALRSVAVGRKNWLFIGSDDHGEAAAAMLSIVASAKLHGLDPELYLRDVLRVIPHWPKPRLLELSAKYWAATRARLDPTQLAQEFGPLTIPTAPEQETTPS